MPRICSGGVEMEISGWGLVKDTPTGELPREGFIRLPDVLRVIPVSKSTWWAGVKSGRFPAPTKRFGPKVAAWNVADIRALLTREDAA